MSVLAKIMRHAENCESGSDPRQPATIARQAQGLPQGTGDAISQLRANRRFGLD
jgi:hypothetical protein